MEKDFLQKVGDLSREEYPILNENDKTIALAQQISFVKGYMVRKKEDDDKQLMTKELVEKLEEYASDRANQVFDIDIDELKQLVIDGANWMNQQK